MHRTLPLRRATALGAAAAAAALTLSACASSGSGTPAAQVSPVTAHTPYQGTYLTAPFPKPDVTLTDTSGKPFDIAKDTAGKAVLLYFGYTKCPDECPTTMGDIAVALQKQPASVRQQTEVVFVSTDPQDDTPKVLRTWLDSFDTNFVGLTGDFATIQKAAKSVGVYVEPPVRSSDGSVTSTHGAQVLAYLPSDGRGHVLYTSGTPVAEYKHDLPLLVKSVTAS